MANDTVPDFMPEESFTQLRDILCKYGERWEVVPDLRQGRPLRVLIRPRPVDPDCKPIECGSLGEAAEVLATLDGGT